MSIEWCRDCQSTTSGNCGKHYIQVDNKIQIDKETAYELLEVLNHQFVDYKYSHVHQLIKQLWKFVGKK